MNTKHNQQLHIKILLWMYEKGHVGFTKDELKSELSISDEEWPWVDWMFFNGPNGSELLAWSIPAHFFKDSEYQYGNKFFPTSSGMGAAVDYLELK